SRQRSAMSHHPPRTGSLEGFCTAGRLLFCFGTFLSASRADQTDEETQKGKLACMDEPTQQAVRAAARGKGQTFCSLPSTRKSV
ncbi:MAG: hypothetical protein ACI4B5_02995, partial [Bacteroidaceae bacterium]